MEKKYNNYAFIDSQNLYMGVRDLGWKLDYKKFRVYLKEKYGVGKAFMFFGYMTKNEELYESLKKDGFDIIFKPVVTNHPDGVKGNVDAELVLQAMIEYSNYDKAVIVTGDGDFQCLVKYLYSKGKHQRLIIPNKRNYSVLLRSILPRKEGMTFLDDLKKRLSYNTYNKR